METHVRVSREKRKRKEGRIIHSDQCLLKDYLLNPKQDHQNNYDL